jgi:hypothetical protein
MKNSMTVRWRTTIKTQSMNIYLVMEEMGVSDLSDNWMMLQKSLPPLPSYKTIPTKDYKANPLNRTDVLR